MSIDAQELQRNGFDGLYLSSPGECCGCLLTDLAPCNEGPFAECKPGYRHQDPKDKDITSWAIFKDKDQPTEAQWDSVRGYY